MPQAVRIVIPPVTNDFIALFKDTSVCSVITLVELTKQYSILANSTGGVVEFAVATAALYLAMSYPLSWFSRWFERRLGAEGRRGGAGMIEVQRSGQAITARCEVLRRDQPDGRAGARSRRSSAPRAAARARSCAASTAWSGSRAGRWSIDGCASTPGIPEPEREAILAGVRRRSAWSSSSSTSSRT